MHAVAADQKQVGLAVHVLADLGEPWVGTEVGGISLFHPQDRGVEYFRGIDDADLASSSTASAVMRSSENPQISSDWLQKYSRPNQTNSGLATRDGLQLLKIWSLPSRTSGSWM